MGYGFMNQEGDARTMTILVIKDRDSRVVMASMVNCKGRGMGEAVDQACANIDRLGKSKKMLMKVDNEPALLYIRNAVSEKLTAECIMEKTRVEEFQSNGSIENGVKFVKGMIRVYKLALERRIRGKLPTIHPVIACLVEHAGENLSKFMIGRDGKTGCKRLLGKPCRDEGVDF